MSKKPRPPKKPGHTQTHAVESKPVLAELHPAIEEAAAALEEEWSNPTFSNLVEPFLSPEAEELKSRVAELEDQLLRKEAADEASVIVLEAELEQSRKEVVKWQEKCTLIMGKAKNLMAEREKLSLQMVDLQEEQAKELISLRAANEELAGKVKRYEEKQSILLEQAEELEEERQELEETKRKWEEMLEEFKLKDARELAAENRSLQLLYNKVKERLQQVEDEYEQYCHTYTAAAEWEQRRNSLESEIEIVRAENKKLREANVSYETVSRLQIEYRFQEESLLRMQQQVDQLTKHNLQLIQDISGFKRNEEKAEQTFNEKEYYRLRCINLETEIKRLRRIEEEAAADESRIFENFVHILEKSPKRENKAAKYESDVNLLAGIQQLAKKADFHFPESMLQSFIASMRSSRFIILKGLSGTGKTSLPRLFASATGGVCDVIPVQPSWKSKTDLIGFFNHFNNRFLATPFTESLFKAALPANRNRFYFILLDEMNLARVEYYFSDFNSKLELEPEKQIVELFDSAGKTSGDLSKYIVDGNKLRIPPNVFFIGTINDDESTYSLSDKIYDRAQVLDFQEIVGGKAGDMRRLDPQEAVSFDDFMVLQETVEAAKVDKELAIMEELLQVLKDEFQIHIGHRPRRQITHFLKTFKTTGKWDMNRAIDLQIVSKIVPKIRFSHSDDFHAHADTLIETIARKLGSGALSIQALEMVKRG